ncbi:interferon-induced 35 kDa protein isoform X2 [Rhinoraja longicauda]
MELANAVIGWARYNAMLNDKKVLLTAKLEIEETTEEYNARIQSFQNCIKDDKLKDATQNLNLQEKLNEVEIEIEMVTEKQNAVKEKITKLDELNAKMVLQLQVSSSMPEKRWVFAGQEAEEHDQERKYDVKPSIRYPIEGGSALITFEDVKVAALISEMRDHKIKIEDNGEIAINIKAWPVKLPTVEKIEIQTHVCKYQVLISDIPRILPVDQLLDKLEIHFSKQMHNGGEVKSIELLEDSGNVVITFVDEKISENLTKNEFHEVVFRGINKKCILRVSPFINGEIERIEAGEIISRKSVLFTGIPDIMDEEKLKDYLQIHFQKPSNGGGEVDAIMYIPEGQSTVTCFELDSP